MEHDLPQNGLLFIHRYKITGNRLNKNQHRAVHSTDNKGCCRVDQRSFCVLVKTIFVSKFLYHGHMKINLLEVILIVIHAIKLKSKFIPIN